MKRAIAGVTTAAAILIGLPALADSDAGDLAQLQVVMQRFIDSQLIDGAMHKVDFESGTVTQYYPTEAHPMVMSLGEDYILCTDLASKDGKSVPVDFYVTPTADGYKVYQTEINNRGPLQELIRNNLVERIR